MDDADEEVEILVSFEEDGREYHLVRLLDPVLLVGKVRARRAPVVRVVPASFSLTGLLSPTSSRLRGARRGTKTRGSS